MQELTEDGRLGLARQKGGAGPQLKGHNYFTTMLSLYSQSCRAPSSSSIAFFIWVLSTHTSPPAHFSFQSLFFTLGGYLICCIPCFPFHEQETCIWAFFCSLPLTSFPKMMLFMEKKRKKEKLKRMGGRMQKEPGDERGFYIQPREEGCKKEWREHQMPLAS